MLRVVLTVCCVCVACELHGRATQHSIFAYILCHLSVFCCPFPLGSPGAFGTFVPLGYCPLYPSPGMSPDFEAL